MPIIYQPAGRAREYAEYAANLYSGCGHGCTYCYAPSATRVDRHKFHTAICPRSRVLAQLRKDCEKLRGADIPPVLLSFTTDPYQPIEDELGITRDAIKIMHEHGLHVHILTKGGMRAARDFDLLTPNDAFAATLTFLDAERSLQWEPGAAVPSDRIKALELAHSLGIPTWVSLEPVIDPEASLSLIQETHPFVDFYKVGKLNYHPAAAAVDWRDFRRRAVALLEALGKRYYMKRDLDCYK